MYYADAEIYRAIRKGVTVSVLAQLNGCDSKEIVNAYDRFSAKIQQDDQTYRRYLEHASKHSSNLNSVINYNIMEERIKMKGRRFVYSEEMNQQIIDLLTSRQSLLNIYNELFKNYSDFDKPSLSAFKAKCRKLLDKIDKSTLDKNQHLQSENSEINKLKEELENELKLITQQFQETIHRIAELEVKIELELKKCND